MPKSNGSTIALLALIVMACETRDPNARQAPEPASTRGSARETRQAQEAAGMRDESARGQAELPRARPHGQLETVALFDGAMPTGVTLSASGRIFVNFPRWGDDVPFTVAELRSGKPVAYPDETTNRLPATTSEPGFVSVQSVVVDPKDRLWVLDTGSVKMQPVSPGAPKLVGIDLVTNKVFKTVTFPPSVVLATSYINDVRFDLRRGKAGLAFITDSSLAGPNGIVVVDLETGHSWRRLHDHPSTKPAPGFLAMVEGRPLVSMEPGKPPESIKIGSDGIAIAADGKRLFYCPLASRRLYAVSVDALANEATPDREVAKTVEDLGEKGASDGLESDAEGRVYLTNYEHDAVMRRKADGSLESLASDPRLLWPDTLSLAGDGYLYVIANQLHRQPQYHSGRDRRQRPYVLFRIKTDGTPVRLR
jgi:sugar lactone lactonase YvrE